MEVISSVMLQCEKNGRVYTFTMPATASYGEAYDTAFEILTKILEMAQTASQKAKPTSTTGDQNSEC